MVMAHAERLTADLSAVERANFASIEGVLPHWAAKDIPGIVSYYTDEITWHPVPEERTYRGKQEVGEFFTAFFGAIPDMDFVLTTKIARGNFISEEFRMRGTHRGRYFGIPPTNKPVELYGMSMARWRGARLHADEFIFDRVVLMEQLGTLPRLAIPRSPVGRSLVRALARLAGSRPGVERQSSIHLTSGREPREVLDIATVIEDSEPLTPVEADNQAVADALVAAVNARDLDGLLALCAPRVVWCDMPRGREWRGASQVRALFGELLTAFPDLRLDPIHRIVRGSTVATQWAMRGTQHGDFLGIPATGRPVDLPGMCMMTVSDGLLYRANFYVDSGMLLRQVGLLPPVTFAQSPAGGVLLWLLVRRARVAAGLAGAGAAAIALRLARRE
jgi:steroid delta-isomerase-like uncharacterized protein